MIGDLFAGFFLIAIVYLMVKPGSGGATAVAAFGATLSVFIRDVVTPGQTREESTQDYGTSVDGNVDITNEQPGG